MQGMLRRSPMPSPGYPVGLLALFVGIMAFVGWDTLVRSRHVLSVSSTYGVTVDAPANSATSPTGYADGMRSVLLPTGSADTAHWIMQTQAMFAKGEWRVRHVTYDNSPDGREVHWGAPFHWWLAALAWVDHVASGRPIGQSVERAVLYSGPVMLVAALLLLIPFLARRFSPMAAAMFLIGLIATYPFYLDFTAGYADHHGAVSLCALLTVLFLAVGGTETGAIARRWFTASAAAGGLGLWISAATQVPVLVAVGVGALAAAWIGRGAPERARWLAEPDLWRHWGRAGAVASLVAWVIEYFPHDFSMRLEVNHPFYALAWLGGGEVVRLGVLALRDGWTAVAPRDRVAGGVGLALVAVLPVTVLGWPAQTFWVADRFLWLLHNQHISEFRGLTYILARGFNANTLSLWLPMALLVPLAAWCLRPGANPRARADLALALVPAVVTAAMAWTQIRWLGLAFALSVPAMAVFFREHAAQSRRWHLGWLLALAIAFGPGFVTTLRRPLAVPEFTTDDMQNLAVRDVGQWLKRWSGPERTVVLASPSTTTKLLLYGGVDGVDTLYWENLPGLRAAAQIFAARSDEEAQALAARLKLTHIVCISWETFEPAMVLLERGLPADSTLPTDAFYARLLQSPVPPLWLQAVPFKLPKHPALDESHVRIWKVVPPQSPATALARATNFYLELGQLDAAAKLAEPLLEYQRELTAMVMLAAIASRDGDQEGFGAAFGQVLARLDQAPPLALDEHLHLVVVLAVGRRADLAQAQLRAAMAKLNDASLRQLSVGTLTDLIALSDGLEVPFPNDDLRKTAQGLLPPK
jgi:hypothetical protein